MGLVFGIGPSILYLTFIHPSILRISNYRNRVEMQASGTPPIRIGPAPATDQELEQLEDIKQSQLARIKEPQNREKLLQFSGILADALAMQARDYGLRVIGVDIQNALIRGRYVPSNNRALDMLAEFPSAQWNELADPLDLPMLNLPSIEIQMTVTGDYSRVFSLIASLPDFPTQVSLTRLGVTDSSSERAFQLRIRGYYYDNNRRTQLARMRNPATR
jgi:hypothetical protein